jgi:hypothetical protein
MPYCRRRQHPRRSIAEAPRRPPLGALAGSPFGLALRAGRARPSPVRVTVALARKQQLRSGPSVVATSCGLKQGWLTEVTRRPFPPHKLLRVLLRRESISSRIAVRDMEAAAVY